MGLPPKEVGSRVREARLARGWTNDELARRMGVNARTVQRWQSGKLPRLSTLARLADVFGLPEVYFVEAEDFGATIEELKRRLDELSGRLDDLMRALDALGSVPPAQGRGGGRRKPGRAP